MEDRLAPARRTDDANALSKRSAVDSGYFKDPFISHFAAYKRRTALVNRGYWLRAVTIDCVFRWFLETFGKHEPCQILSLGAGFDTAFFRLAAACDLPAGLCFFEVDFRETAAQKQAIIESNVELRRLAAGSGRDGGGPIVMHVAIGADLRDIQSLEAALASLEAPTFDFTRPTLVLSEVALVYLSAEASDAVLAWVGGRFPRAYVAVYEQVCPSDAFGQVMCRHFEAIRSPLLSINTYPSIEAQAQRHRCCGLEMIHALDMNEVLAQIAPDVRKHAFHLEAFDEFEEWRLTCGHYVLLCSKTARLQGTASPSLGPIARVPWLRCEPHRTNLPHNLGRPASVAVQTQLVGNGLCQRFAHCVCPLGHSCAFIFGGCGPDFAGRHGRRATAQVVDCARLHAYQVASDAPLHAVGPMHAACVPVKAGVAIIGGRNGPKAVPGASVAVTLLAFPAELPDAGPVEARVSVLEVPSGTPAPAARWRHCAVAVAPDQRFVALFGGRSADAVLADLWLLDTATGRWGRLEPEGAQGPVSRHSHAATAVSPPAPAGIGAWLPVMLVTGGLSEGEEPLDDAFMLELRSPVHLGSEARWRRLEVPGRLLQRFGHTAHISSGTAVLVGGVAVGPASPGAEAPLEWWTLHLDGTELRCGKVHQASLQAAHHGDAHDAGPFLTHGHGSIIFRDELLVLGGGGSCFSFGTHINAPALRVLLTQVLAGAEAHDEVAEAVCPSASGSPR